MRYSCYCLTVISSFWIAAGCGTSHPRTTPAPDTQSGVYSFFERVPGTSPALVLEGKFTLRDGTIEVEATPGPCRYEELDSQTLFIVYRCSDVTLTFDRSNPVQHVKYQAMSTVYEKRTTCARRVSSQSSCDARTETVERQVSRSGWLRPKRIG